MCTRISSMSAPCLRRATMAALTVAALTNCGLAPTTVRIFMLTTLPLLVAGRLENFEEAVAPRALVTVSAQERTNRFARPALSRFLFESVCARGPLGAACAFERQHRRRQAASATRRF